MQLPFFYTESVSVNSRDILLEEEASRHIVQVLRMKEGDQINITDGIGNLFTAEIVSAHKKHCGVSILSNQYFDQPAPRTIIGISLLKNSARFEWFLEKATELGISEIVPLICDRTEKEKFRGDRMKNILVSAMLQSQQCWLPLLHQPISFELLFAMEDIVSSESKLIAHCMEGEKKELQYVLKDEKSKVLLIGPEGDFTPEEISFAIRNKFLPVSLGKTRLRTETAGMVGAVLLKQGGDRC